ncbi:MAG: transposase [Gemmatimonadaceae bacterium]|nr:transposase [Gemmatimonadaceae bacterium]
MAALRRAEGGTSVADVIPKLGITETFVYRWKTRHTGLEVSDLRERNSLREENAKLRRVVADLVLHETIVKDALGFASAVSRGGVGLRTRTGSASGAPAASSVSDAT